MAEEQFQEKTEQATPKRREDARKKGQVARSAEISSVAVLATSLLGLVAFGPILARILGDLAVAQFEHLSQIEITGATLPGLAASWTWTFARAAALPALLAALVGTAAAVLQVGWKPSAESLQFKWERFNVASGLKRLFGGRALFQLARDTLKLALIGWVAYLAIRSETTRFPLFVDLDAAGIAMTLGGMALRVGFKITAVLLVIAAADYAYQRYDYEKNLRMTRQEVKEELKHLEGDPQIKSRIRRIQREMSRKRMMDEVAKADVVVTNPTHLAVALRYDRDTMSAPTVVAKGAELIAQKIREIAALHGIPVIENRPLAQALYRTVEVGLEIPEALFEAAAGVLAMAYRMRRGEVS
jgi:flagellar biosynthetic protein FlhB